MWFWIFIIISPFILFAIIEETINYFVDRYINNTAVTESKWKKIFNKVKSKSREKHAS